MYERCTALCGRCRVVYVRDVLVRSCGSHGELIVRCQAACCFEVCNCVAATVSSVDWTGSTVQAVRQLASWLESVVNSPRIPLVCNSLLL